MKRSVLLIVVALVCASAYVLLDDSTDTDAIVVSYSGSCGDDVQFNFDMDTGTLTLSGSGTMNPYTNDAVPWSTYMDKIKSVVVTGTVSSLCDYAFFEANAMVSADLTPVKTIGNNAFYDNFSLTSVVLGGSLESIGASAFSCCTLLASADIPDNVQTIGIYAFSETAIRSASIPATLTSLGNYAFDGCDSLASFDVAEGNSKYSDVDGVLFDKDKTKLIKYPAARAGAEYTVPATATSVEERAFEGCKTLTNVNLGSVTAIPEEAFSDCTSLITVTSNSVTEIGEDAFSGCTALATIGLGSVEQIERYAFSGCSSLTSVDLGSLKMIDYDAFEFCTGLTTVTLPASLLSMGSDVFFGCTSLTKINVDANNVSFTSDSGVLYDKEKTKLWQYPSMKGSTEYTIPASVTKIEGYAFYKCVNLKSIKVAEGNTSYSADEGGVLYDYAKEELIAYPAGKTDDTYTIPNTVTDSKSPYIFCGCDSLKKIILPDSLNLLDTYDLLEAMANCPALESVGFSDANAKYQNIGNVLFTKDGKTMVLCPSAKSGEYTVPEGTETIGSYAFAGASRITAVKLSDSVKTISNYAFCGCASDGTGCSSLCSITFGSGLESVGFNPFYHISFNIDGKSIGATVENLKGKTFYVCNGGLDTGLVLGDSAKGHVLTEVAEDTANDVKAHQSCSVCGKNFLNGKVATEADLKISSSGSGTSGDSGSSGDSGTSGDSGSTGDSGTTDGSGSSDGNGKSDGSGSSDGNGSNNSTNVTVAVGGILAILVLVGAYLYYRRMN